MKPFLKYFIASLIISLALITNSYASETVRTFLDGIRYYKEGDFSKAVKAFSSIANTGVNNSKLFYNLGNAYLKNGDPGYAILWYERALKMTPNAPDLKFNHEYALSLVKDEKEDKTSPVFRVLFFWQHLLSEQTVRLTAIFLNMIFWLILIIQAICRKRLLRTVNYLLLTLTIVFTLTAFYNYYEAIYIKNGVILPAEVSVRSGLTEDATELFVLHAGTKVNIDREKKSFYRIFFSEGKIGWIRKSDVGVI